MDLWATDSFYSHFPSYSDQKTHREILLKSRQLEYQTYLSRLARVEQLNDAKTSKRVASVGSESKRQKIPTETESVDELGQNLAGKSPYKENVAIAENTFQLDRVNKSAENVESCSSSESRKNRYLNELDEINVPDILNEDAINERNRQIAEEKYLKQLQYQRDLMEQIKQKRLERERNKAKELQEEERLTRKVEEQLRMVRLHDEWERQQQIRYRERNLYNFDTTRLNPNKQSSRLQSTKIANKNDESVSTHRSYDDRVAQSEHEKENMTATKCGDRKVYKFFTNSARDPINHKHSYHNKYADLPEVSDDDAMANSIRSSYNTYPSKKNRHEKQPCNQCQLETTRPSMCNLRQQSLFLASNQRENTASFDHDSMQYAAHYNEPLCSSCRKEICARCKKPTNNDEQIMNKYLKSQRNHQESQPVASRRKHQSLPSKNHNTRQSDGYESDREDESIDANKGELSIAEKTNHKPYSFNLKKTSIFHPSMSLDDAKLKVNVKNDEMFTGRDALNELRRITDEKLSKYAKNYGELRTRDSKNKSTGVDTNPKTSLTEYTNKVKEFVGEVKNDRNSEAFKQLESKWQIPIVQKYNTARSSDGSTGTFTQTGAFGKHLRSDRLFDLDDFSSIYSNKH